MRDTANPLEPWWRRRPDRLRWELTNFADRGLPSGFQDGTIHSQLELSDGRLVDVDIDLPFEYPRHHPTARVPRGLVGPPHEESGVLCLFDNPGSQWHPQRDAAALVDHNVRELLEAVLVRGDIAWVSMSEEQIPDPVSRRWIVDRDYVVFVPDPFWGPIPSGADRGIFTLAGKEKRWIVDLLTPHGPREQEDLGERVLCTETAGIGRWVALPNPPAGLCRPSALLDAAREVDPDILAPYVYENTSLTLGWVAVTFEEQGPGRGETRRGWQFVSISGPDTVPPRAVYMPQTQALTPAERSLRLPELRGLHDFKIMLVGLGSLGSKVALELAKAGVGHLTLIDDDRYDANNAVRHELPVCAAGEGKAVAMGQICERINPFCTADPNPFMVGRDRDSAARLLAALDDAALVVETTGSREVTRIMQRYCRLTGVVLVSASLTRGSRGGDLVVLRDELCFDCFLIAQEEGDIPQPEQGPQPLVLPVGCSSPAFSGAGFDASELSSIVARTAVRATGATQYPVLDHDWAVVNFVGDPHFQSGVLAPDPACRHFDG